MNQTADFYEKNLSIGELQDIIDMAISCFWAIYLYDTFLRVVSIFGKF